MNLRRSVSFVLVVLGPLSTGCGKSSTCRQLAVRNENASQAIHDYIIADYEGFADYTEKQMGRRPPKRVGDSASDSARQWQATLTDPQFAQDCVTEMDDAQVERIALCLDQREDAAYASCILEALEVPMLGHELGGD